MPNSASNPSMAFRRAELLVGLAAVVTWTSAVAAPAYPYHLRSTAHSYLPEPTAAFSAETHSIAKNCIFEQLRPPATNLCERLGLESVPKSELEVGLLEEQRQRKLVQDLLGSDRWRRLEKARFEIALHEYGFSPRLSEDPFKQELVEEILMSTLVRVSKKSVERRLRLMERRDALRARVHGVDPEDLGRRDRPGLDLSPAVRLSDRPSLGARVRLEGLDSWFWSGLSFRVRHEVSGGDLSLKLGYESRRRSSFVIYHTEHRSLGEAIECGVRFSF